MSPAPNGTSPVKVFGVFFFPREEWEALKRLRRKVICSDLHCKNVNPVTVWRLNKKKAILIGTETPIRTQFLMSQ